MQFDSSGKNQESHSSVVWRQSGQTLTLTPAVFFVFYAPLLARRIDDEIYVDFMSTFAPNVPRIDILDEDKDFKSPEMKEKWRNFINRYEGGKVTDYNFGSLLRLDASKEYSEDNTIFGKFFNGRGRQAHKGEGGIEVDAMRSDA